MRRHHGTGRLSQRGKSGMRGVWLIGMLAGVAALASSGCPAPRPATAVVVQVFATDAVLAMRPTSLSFDVRGGSAPDALDPAPPETVTVGDWPVLLTLVPREPGERSFAVDVVALDDGGATLATARLRSQFVLGQSRTHVLWLDTGCGPCTQDTTCRAGTCAPATLEPGALEPFEGRIDAGARADGTLDSGAFDAGADTGALDAALDSGASDAGADAASLDAHGADAAVAPDAAVVCMAGDVPAADRAVFVSAGAADDMASGTPGDPFRSIGAALGARGSRALVVIAKGTYPEALRLDGASVHLLGGFRQSGAEWSRDCDALPSETRVASPTSLGIDARDLTGELTLERLEIEAAPGTNGGPGETGGSSTAVFVGRSVSRVLVLDSNVRAGAAGAGGVGARGVDGATCAPTAPCTSTPRGGMTGGVGRAGAAGGFGEAGYDAPAGETGGAGGSGEYGSPPPSPDTRSDCADTCAGDGRPTCGILTRRTLAASVGSCGCGGVGGGGGRGGGAGGASVALLTTGATRVELRRATVAARDGGGGGPGGEGGSGAPGQPGADGMSMYCARNCASCTDIVGCACTPSDFVTLRGPAGGMGAAGGTGGRGGGGVGGPSYGIVLASGALLEGLASGIVDHGAGGTGAGGAANGPADDVLGP